MLKVFSVSEFLAAVNEIILGEFVVEGEISQCKISQGKWLFFDLKDGVSVLSCFATIFTVGSALADGMRVRVTGYPKVREQTGRFGFTVQKVELLGEGALKRAYELLKKQLADEGLFNSARKRALPELPSNVAVIASRDSAAFGDFHRILNNRWGGVTIHLYHVTVQGESAVGEIVNAVQFCNEHAADFDLLAIIRGGGSWEDLAAFNSEAVVRAVYGSKLPVVSGIGHERDETLIDFVADVRASTPSNAAEIIVPERRDMVRQVNALMDHAGERLSHRVQLATRTVLQTAETLISRLVRPIEQARGIIGQFVNQASILERFVERQHEFVVASQRLFHSVDPKRVLQRGYSITRNKKGRVVRSSHDVDSGDPLVIELAEGIIEAEVARPQRKLGI